MDSNNDCKGFPVRQNLPMSQREFAIGETHPLPSNAPATHRAGRGAPCGQRLDPVRREGMPPPAARTRVREPGRV